MAKPSPARLHLAAYPDVRSYDPRFGDVDRFQHLNNVAIGRYYEDSRIRFLDTSGVREALDEGSGVTLAEFSMQYLLEGFYPHPLTLGTGVLRVGGASLVLGQALFQRGHCIGTSECVIVHVKAGGGPGPWPDAARAVLTDPKFALNIPSD
jgi:acyl-CoA thioester hydrolase